MNSKDKYYIFGKEASDKIINGQPVDERFADEFEGDIYKFPSNGDPSEILSKFIGWDGYAEISEIDYVTLGGVPKGEDKSGLSKHKEIELAKDFLQQSGYCVDSMWHAADITSEYFCPQEWAREIIESISGSDYIIGEINASISDYAEDAGLVKRSDSLTVVTYYFDESEEESLTGTICSVELEDTHGLVNDEDILFYGMSREECEAFVKSGEKTDGDFYIEKIIS